MGTLFLEIRRISTKLAKEYIYQNHYSHGSHHSPSPCYGLYDEENLVGILMFSVPCSERVRSSMFGSEYKSVVLELHRLHIQDNQEMKNIESWFIAKCLHQLRIDRPDIKCVVSFSDPSAGHKGTIYQATNAHYYGRSSKATFYLDAEDRLHHPRQCGVNITRSMAIERNWTSTIREGKYRYFWLQCGKVEKKYWMSRLKVNILPYP
jgi:hypothetical protein